MGIIPILLLHLFIPYAVATFISTWKYIAVIIVFLITLLTWFFSKNITFEGSLSFIDEAAWKFSACGAFIGLIVNALITSKKTSFSKTSAIVFGGIICLLFAAYTFFT
jgi:hypothetical protein